MPVTDADVRSTILMHRLGERLKKVRNARGLSQREVAEAVGLSQALISLIEQGKRQLPLRAIERLASLLNTDPSALIAPVDPEDVMRELLRTWSAYRAARESYVWLQDETVEMVRLLGERERVIQASIGVAAFNLAKHPHHYTEATFLEEVHDRAPKPIAERGEQRSFPVAAVGNRDRVRALSKFLQTASKLDKGDLGLVTEMAARLAGVRSEAMNR